MLDLAAYSITAKIFTEFVVLIIRSRIYMLLKDKMEKLDKKPNFMTVFAAIRELGKIEMIRQTEGRYRLNHVVTATRKTILKAFDMDAGVVRSRANELSDILMKYDNEIMLC